MRIGAHVSAAGGLDRAIDRAQELGCETIQVFGSSPQSWAYKPPPQEVCEAFKRKARAAGIGPAFLHGIYLINLGSPTQENLSKSVAALANAMNLAAQIDAAGVIFHAGSHRGAGYEGIFKQAVSSLEEVLKKTPEKAWLIIENSAGMGQHIGSRFEEIGRIMKALGSPRVKVCLDTQHCFAAGYNIASKEGIKKAMEEFHHHIGLESLVAVHANDAKVPFASGVDRHENIGEGHIGRAGFEVIMGHSAFRDVPFLLEVPGADGKGPDRENVDRLKAIRTAVGVKA